jgi:hypothetical protein
MLLDRPNLQRLSQHLQRNPDAVNPGGMPNVSQPVDLLQ